MKKRTSLFALVTLGLLTVSAATIFFEMSYTWVHDLRMIVGSVVVLILPGYWITRWTFPLRDNEKIMDPTDETITDITDIQGNKTIEAIDGLERFVLSVALSISSVPLLLFYVNFLGVPLTIWSVFFTICLVTLGSI